MTSHEHSSINRETAEDKRTFGEVARARSEEILQRYGKTVETGDGKAWLVYEWTAGWHWWKKFTLSRPDEAMVSQDTPYTLQFKDLTRSGDNGHYDFSQRNGLLESTFVSLRHILETNVPDTAATHREQVLDYLSSLEKVQTDGLGF